MAREGLRTGTCGCDSPLIPPLPCAPLLQRAAGLDHGAWAHSQQASACFQAAVDAAELDPYVDRASVKALRTTTRTNMDFMEQSYLYPFSLSEAEMARLARANLDLAAKPVLLEIPRGL